MSNNSQQTVQLSPRSMFRLEGYEQQNSMFFVRDRLRQRCIDFLKKQAHALSDKPYADNAGLCDRADFRFAWQLVSTYRSTLPDIQRDVSGCTPKILYRELCSTRRCHLVGFVRSQLSRRWDIVEDDDETWRTFANNIPFDDPARSREVSEFFHLLDSISIINDILMGHGEEYGIDMELIVPEELEVEEIHELKSEPVSTAETKTGLGNEGNFAPVATNEEHPSPVVVEDDGQELSKPWVPAASLEERGQYGLAMSLSVNSKKAQMVMQELEELIAGKSKPKDIVRPIRAAIKAGVLIRPQYKEFCKLFPDVKVSRSSYDDYLKDDNTAYKGDTTYDRIFFHFQNIFKTKK